MLLMLSFAVSVSTVCFLSDFSSFLIESKDVLYPASSAFSASISLAISSFSFLYADMISLNLNASIENA